MPTLLDSIAKIQLFLVTNSDRAVYQIGYPVTVFYMIVDNENLGVPLIINNVLVGTKEKKEMMRKLHAATFKNEL